MKNTERKCKCLSISMLADDPNVPIQYNCELNEYYLVYGDNGQIYFYYCFACGGRLPKSKRDELFTKPSRNEMTKIRDKIRGARSVEAIVAILGEPDEQHGPITHTSEQKEKYKMKDVKRTLRYTSLARTLNFLLQEYEDGEFAFFFEGKPKISNR